MNDNAKDDDRRRRDRERKQRQRERQSEEAKQRNRKIDRERQQLKRANMSEEEKERHRERSRILIHERRSNMSVEEMERGREHDRVRHEERCSNMSTEELEMMRERNRANQQERREEARGNLSPEQAELIRENVRLWWQLAPNNKTPVQRQLLQERNALYCHLQQIREMSTESGIVERNEYKENVREITPQDISGNIQVEQFILACQESLCQTILHEEEADYEENKEIHRMLICVVCNEAIIGKDVYHWIDRKTLKFHGNVLSHTNFYKDGINNLLKAQYTLVDEHLHGLLLSPRSRRRICAEGDPSYMCCSICQTSLQS
ncbi:MAG: hypothetical protein ACK51L_04885 [bacterium]